MTKSEKIEVYKSLSVYKEPFSVSDDYMVVYSFTKHKAQYMVVRRKNTDDSYLLMYEGKDLLEHLGVGRNGNSEKFYEWCVGEAYNVSEESYWRWAESNLFDGKMYELYIKYIFSEFPWTTRAKITDDADYRLAHKLYFESDRFDLDRIELLKMVDDVFHKNDYGQGIFIVKHANISQPIYSFLYAEGYPMLIFIHERLYDEAVSVLEEEGFELRKECVKPFADVNPLSALRIIIPNLVGEE